MFADHRVVQTSIDGVNGHAILVNPHLLPPRVPSVAIKHKNRTYRSPIRRVLTELQGRGAFG